VTAEHHDNCAFVACSISDRVHDLQEIAGDENVGKGFQERGEASILAGR